MPVPERPPPDDTPPPRTKREILEERAVAWLESKNPAGPTCALCGQKEWQVTDLVELRTFNQGHLDLSAGVYPALQLICTNCGNTLLFNAIRAGLVDLAPTPTPAETTDPEQ